MPDSDSTPVPTFADLLNELFERRRRRDGSRFSLRDIATAMSGEIEPDTVSHQYLSRLRNGIDDNPSLRMLEALCIVFDVSPEYFFPRLQGRPHAPLPPRDPDHER